MKYLIILLLFLAACSTTKKSKSVVTSLAGQYKADLTIKNDSVRHTHTSGYNSVLFSITDSMSYDSVITPTAKYYGVRKKSSNTSSTQTSNTSSTSQQITSTFKQSEDSTIDYNYSAITEKEKSNSNVLLISVSIICIVIVVLFFLLRFILE